MELRTLQYFLAIAQEENMTRAAAQLHVSQPSLSRQLAQLERQYKVQLFIRDKHRLILTDAGRLLRRRAQEMLLLADKAEQELLGNHLVAGNISFGCGETKNVAVLSQHMAAFGRIHPEVTFSLFTLIADEVKDRLANGTLDFGLVLEPVDISTYNYLQYPIPESWCVLVRKDCPLAAKEVVTPEDLIGYPLIMAQRRSVRNELEHWFGPAFPQVHIWVTSNLSYSNRSLMVKNGLGVALAHEFEGINPELRQIPLSPGLIDQTYLVWNKYQELSPAVGAFVDYARQQLEGTGDE